MIEFSRLRAGQSALFPSLDIGNCIAVKLGRFREVPHRPIRLSHIALAILRTASSSDAPSGTHSSVESELTLQILADLPRGTIVVLPRTSMLKRVGPSQCVRAHYATPTWPANRSAKANRCSWGAGIRSVVKYLACPGQRNGDRRTGLGRSCYRNLARHETWPIRQASLAGSVPTDLQAGRIAAALASVTGISLEQLEPFGLVHFPLWTPAKSGAVDRSMARAACLGS